MRLHPGTYNDCCCCLNHGSTCSLFVELNYASRVIPKFSINNYVFLITFWYDVMGMLLIINEIKRLQVNMLLT